MLGDEEREEKGKKNRHKEGTKRCILMGSEIFVNSKLGLIHSAKSVVVFDIMNSWASKEISVVDFCTL